MHIGKRAIVLGIAVLLLPSLVACGAKDEKEKKESETAIEMNADEEKKEEKKEEVKETLPVADTVHTELIDPEKAEIIWDSFYKYTRGEFTGLIVRELHIDAVNPDAKEKVEVVQISDAHLNYINDKDREENNPVIMSTYENRKWNKDASSYLNLLRAMQYAGQSDQIVLTGDTMDYLSWGAFELLQKGVWDKYPETLVALGNHEPVRKMQGNVADPTSLESRYQILQENWAHDIYYTSRVIKDSVMVIQMDDSQLRFWDSQVAQLEADLKLAREKQYTVLLFMHCAVDTRDSSERAFAIWENDGRNWDFAQYKLVGRDAQAGSATQKICDLIANNGDVIRGVFTGHMHADYFIPITAKTSTGEQTQIPQYALTGCAYNKGHVFKIIVE
ncbi:MAG: metallophosphoesterase [Faecalimonas sp.]|nr:metallophosphoesterase [Faecalimonas sp.]